MLIRVAHTALQHSLAATQSESHTTLLVTTYMVPTVPLVPASPHARIKPNSTTWTLRTCAHSTGVEARIVVSFSEGFFRLLSVL
jgi:hypothetical protein